ncbi:rhodanese-like domain-containing protein [Caminibacter sp.]
MKKIIIFLSVFLFAYESIPATVDNIKKLKQNKIPIVDIRTSDEWMMTGVIPGAVRDTFFDEYGRINPDFFTKIKHFKQFAIICRTGHRSALAAEILENRGYKVIDLEGGMFYLMRSMLHKVFK